METKELIQLLIKNLNREANEADKLEVHLKLLQILNKIRSVNDDYTKLG